MELASGAEQGDLPLTLLDLAGDFLQRSPQGGAIPGSYISFSPSDCRGVSERYTALRMWN